MPDHLQDRIQDDNVDPYEKQADLFQFMDNLGLRRGDEWTYKRMYSLLATHTLSKEQQRLMTPKEKWTNKNQLRDDYLKHVKHLMAPAIWIDTLPATLTELALQYPDVYKSVIGDMVPEKKSMRRWSMRSTRRSRAGTKAEAARRASTSQNRKVHGHAEEVSA